MVVSKSQLMSSLQTIDNIKDNIYKSEGPHIGGVIGPNRLFGGYIAAQVYDAVQKFKDTIGNDKVIFSMHHNFVAAGDPLKPIQLKVERHEDVFTIECSHENKNIGLAHVKVDNKFLESPGYPKGVPALTDIPAIETSIKQIPTEKTRKVFLFLMDKFIFEMRPFHFVKPPGPKDHRVVFYARLHPECREQVKEDAGMITVIALSDFFVIQSAQNALSKGGFKMVSGASLHHKVYFHKSYVEASQWFLVETRTETINVNKAKIFGAVFDSNRDCVVSFIQEAYVTPSERNPSASKL